MSEVVIVGIDCATQAKKVGLARGVWDGTAVTLTDLTPGGDVTSIARTIAGWMAPDVRTLLALDAPLGWPEPLGRELLRHAAGQAVTTPPNALFRRKTDRIVKQALGKLPLDVGADRIARTAHMALTLLADLRAHTEQPIPLAWSPDFAAAAAAIEVYPAGSLAARRWQSSGYKGPDGRSTRADMLAKLAAELVFACDTAALLDSDDVLDAAVAVLAGADFLQDRSIHPTNLALARREGWIWVRPLAASVT